MEAFPISASSASVLNGTPRRCRGSPPPTPRHQRHPRVEVLRRSARDYSPGRPPSSAAATRRGIQVRRPCEGRDAARRFLGRGPAQSRPRGCMGWRGLWQRPSSRAAVGEGCGLGCLACVALAFEGRLPKARLSGKVSAKKPPYRPARFGRAEQHGGTGGCKALLAKGNRGRGPLLKGDGTAPVGCLFIETDLF